MFNNLLIFFAIAVAVTYIAKKINKPYTILLVLTGLIMGFLPINSLKENLANDSTFSTIVVMIFLSALLGDASLKLKFKELNENKKPILLLSIFSTILTFLIVSGLSFWILKLSIQQSLIFGSLMSATDPVSVLSLFKSMGLNKKLSLIVEGESLANDGVAVVLFKIALITTTITASSIFNASFLFLKVITLSILIGLITGFLVSFITSKIDDYLVEIGISIVLFYGTFQIAEHFHLSGVVAVVVSGLILGNHGKNIGMSDITLEKVDSFWEIISFIANSIIFLLVGLEISNISFDKNWIFTIFVSIIIVIISRFLSVFISLKFDKSISNKWKHVVSWGGLKGSLSIALILSLPADFTGREMLLALVFSNVLCSLILQGCTINFLIDKLKIEKQ